MSILKITTTYVHFIDTQDDDNLESMKEFTLESGEIDLDALKDAAIDNSVMEFNEDFNAYYDSGEATIETVTDKDELERIAQAMQD